MITSIIIMVIANKLGRGCLRALGQRGGHPRRGGPGQFDFERISSAIDAVYFFFSLAISVFIETRLIRSLDYMLSSSKMCI